MCEDKICVGIFFTFIFLWHPVIIMQIHLWIWNICRNIFLQRFCCIKPYSLTTLKAISDFIIFHKNKENDYNVNGRKVKSTFERNYYLFAYLLEGLRRRFYIYVIKSCICIHTFFKANCSIFCSFTKKNNSLFL